MILRPQILSALLAVFAFGCSEAKKEAVELEGFSHLKFGMSFDEAMASTSYQMFSYLSLQGCWNERAIRGCYLQPKDSFVNYKTIDGMSYALSLSFNKFDKLTDIDLSFARDSGVDGGQSVTESDCRSIYERTVDWVAREFGPLDPPKADDAKNGTFQRTAAGNAFWHSRPEGWNGFRTFVSRAMARQRQVSVHGSYIILDESRMCIVSADFSESQDVARWSMRPKSAPNQAVHDEAPATSGQTSDDEDGEKVVAGPPLVMDDLGENGPTSSPSTEASTETAVE